MKNIKKTAIALLVLSTAMLTACGSKGGSSSAKTSESSSTQESSTKVSSESSISSGSTSTSSEKVSSTASSSESTSVGESSNETLNVNVVISGQTQVDEGSTIKLSATVTGATDTSVTWTSSAEDIASVTNGTVTGLKAGKATIRATSVADPTKYDEMEITVKGKVAAELKVSAMITSYTDLDDQKNVIEEGAGAQTLLVKIENLPAGKTMDDVTITWPSNNAFHTIIADHSEFAGQKNVKGITFTNAGKDFIEIGVSIDGKSYDQQLVFNITRKDADYTVINTVDQFIKLIEKEGTFGGKYKLGANIDLTGYTHVGGKATHFNGVLDGDGYGVFGFTEAPETADGVHSDGGLFTYVDGIVRNMYIQGNINASAGWSGLLAKEIGWTAAVQDVLAISDDITPETIEGDGWTWARNGVLAGMIKGYVSDCVTMEDPDGERNPRTITTSAYGWYRTEEGDGKGILHNVYTNGDNTGENSLAYPFGPDAGWSSADRIIDCNPNWNYKTALASDYTLGSNWTLADNQMPHLAHYGEAALTITPTVSLTGKTTVKAGESIQLTATPALVDASEAISYAYTSSSDAIATVTNEGLVTGVAEGEATITVTMTYKGSEYTATHVVKVTAADAPVSLNDAYNVTLGGGAGAWEKVVISWEDDEFDVASEVSTKNISVKVTKPDNGVITLSGLIDRCEADNTNNKLYFGASLSTAEFSALDCVWEIEITAADGKVYHIQFNAVYADGNITISNKTINEVVLTKVNVAFNAQNDTENTTKEYIVGKEYGELPAPTKEGFAFDGWYTEAEGGTKVTTSTIVTEAVTTLYAHWIDASSTVGISINTTTTKVEGAGVFVYVNDNLFSGLTVNDINVVFNEFRSFDTESQGYVNMSKDVNKIWVQDGGMYFSIAAGFPASWNFELEFTVSFTKNGTNYSSVLVFRSNALASVDGVAI